MTQQPNPPSNTREAWRSATVEERFAHLNSEWIPTARHQAVVDAVAEQLDYVRLTKQSRGLLVLCGSGGGKSALCRQLKRVYPDIESEELTRRQLVVMNVPKRCSEVTLASALLEGLGDPAFNIGKARDNRKRAINLLESTGVKVLAVDNFQDIPEHRSTDGVRTVGNWFRDLFDDTKLLMLALGTDNAKKVRLANDQVRRRVVTQMRIPYFSVDTDEHLKECMFVLKEFDERMPLAEDSQLRSPKTAALLYFACNGIFGYLCQLLQRAMVLAAQRQSERIEKVDLEQAFAFIAGDVAELGNPFGPEFKGRELDRVDELFDRMERRIVQESDVDG